MNHSLNITINNTPPALTEQYAFEKKQQKSMKILNSYTISNQERDIPENHRAIILPKEIDRVVWRRIL
jgi:hypothetical protein